MTERSVHVWTECPSATRQLIVVGTATDGRPPVGQIALDKEGALELAQKLLHLAGTIEQTRPPVVGMPRRLR